MAVHLHTGAYVAYTFEDWEHTQIFACGVKHVTDKCTCRYMLRCPKCGNVHWAIGEAVNGLPVNSTKAINIWCNDCQANHPDTITLPSI